MAMQPRHVKLNPGSRLVGLLAVQNANPFNFAFNLSAIMCLRANEETF